MLDYPAAGSDELGLNHPDFQFILSISVNICETESNTAELALVQV